MPTVAWDLGSDLPLLDPSEDTYGYAPFASQLAAAIVDNKSPQGLVLAVHGKWGSGKSSLLNFIKHDLKKLPDDRRPVLVDFNPWWFEGRDQIASQLLAQFASQLPDRLKYLRPLARLVGRYSKQIADVAADVSGWGWIKKPAAALLGWLPGIKALTKKTDVPSVKKEIASALKSLGKRFVFFVDDIDRLTPDEARDFFRAIKALADFPEVVYVLFFDREEVSKALTASLQMDGEAYLEKIVQAPFDLPAVDKDQLQNKLFKGLDSIIESRPMPFPFDQSRWAEVFSDGLDQLIKKPRDIVRILNSISVSYPPLAGEVNPVDFIALEFLRVFEPAAYRSIRDAKEFFCGTPTQLDSKRAKDKLYFETWKENLPDSSREGMANLIGRLFPKVAEVLGHGLVTRDDFGAWRKELRPCSEDCFDIYFQFGVPPGRVSMAELDRLTGEATSEGMAALLLESRDQIFPDGHSKSRDLIERLRDFDKLRPEQASKLIEALVGHGHELLRPEDERGGFFTMPNRWRIGGLITKQLERLAASDRQFLMLRLAENSPGLWSLVVLADYALLAKRDPSKAPKAMVDLDVDFAEQFSRSVAARLDVATLDQLLPMPELDLIILRWSVWGDPVRIREVFKPMGDDDERLIVLLDKFVRTGQRYSGRKSSETYQLSMKPLAAAIDVKAMEPRVKAIHLRADLSPRIRAATRRFLQGLVAMEKGQDPDQLHFDDDDAD
jgi:predicted KAP-like P-loop ATPase